MTFSRPGPPPARRRGRCAQPSLKGLSSPCWPTGGSRISALPIAYLQLILSSETTMAAALHLDVQSNGIACLTFDQPGSKANTLGQAVLTEFEAVLEQLESRNDLKGLTLVSAKPGMFIAGADLKELGSAMLNSEETR